MTSNLIITPRRGAFDVDRIRAWLDARPDTFEHPHERNTYLICGYPSTAVRDFENLSHDPTAYPRVCVAHLAQDKILLNQEAGDASDLRSSMDFLDWLVHEFECQVQIDGYSDITDQIETNGVRGLYSPSVRIASLPWVGSLIAIGFFRELHHGDPAGPSLELWRQRVASPEDADVAAYLESGHLLRRAVPLSVSHPWLQSKGGDSTYDVLTDEDIDIGPPHLLTDGQYVWPADLPYYVRAYHVRLPRSFVVHAKRNGWQVPHVEVATLPEF